MEMMIDRFVVNIPDDYTPVPSKAGDTVGSASFMKQTENAACLAMYCPIPSEQAMPFNSVEQVLAGIRGVLAPDQGIIEVRSGSTAHDRKFIYSIIKTVNRGTVQGAQYILTMHLGYYADYVFQAQVFCDETGLTGARDTSVFEILKFDGKIGENGEGWTRDPYDESYTSGALMNLSEKEEYDETFPNHPLSLARKVAKFLIENN